MKGRRARVWLGLVLSVAALALVLRQVDVAAVRAALRQAPPRALAEVALWFLLAMLTRAWAWQALLGPGVGFATAFWALQVGFLFNTLLPFRLGEALRAWVVHREAGVSWPRALSSVALARATDAALLAGVLVLTWPGGAAARRPWAWRAGALLAALLGGLLALAWLRRNPQRLPARWRSAVQEAAAVARGRALVRFALGKALTWSLLAAYFRGLARAWLPHLPWDAAAWGMAATTLGIALPSAPGYIGVYEAAAVAVMGHLGLEADRALAFALLQHGLYLALTTALGLLALARLGWGWQRWRREWRAANRQAQQPRMHADERGLIKQKITKKRE